MPKSAQRRQKALSYVGAGGKVLEITGLSGSTPAEERKRGFDMCAADDGLEILARADGKWNYDDAMAKVDSLLDIYPDADLIYAHNDRMAVAARAAADRHGLSDIKIIGIDAAPNIGIKAVADSVIDATFVYPTEGYQLLRTATAILNGEPFERTIMFRNPIMVDAANAAILLRQDEALRGETEKIKRAVGQNRRFLETPFVADGDSLWRFRDSHTPRCGDFLMMRSYWSNRRTVSRWSVETLNWPGKKKKYHVCISSCKTPRNLS